MTTKALFVKLEAKPGKENEVAKFLCDGQGLVAQEPATPAWFRHSTWPEHLRHLRRISGRDAHLSGKVAKALMEKAPFTDLYGFVYPVHTATFIARISGQTAPSGVGVYII